LEKGSLVYINYTLRIKDEGKVVDTTLEDVAKQAGIYNPEVRYEPSLVAVGDGWVVPGLDEALLQMSEGEKRTLEVPPEKAYGQRDPARIKLIPLRKFGADASKMRVGDQVDIGGQVGVVSYIGSGRVAIDFNHRLAGKTLIYDVEVVKALKDVGEKVRALVSYTLKIREGDIVVSTDAESATVTLPVDKYNEGAYYMRRIAASYVFKYVPGIKRLVFQEIYEKPAEESAKPAEESAKPAEESAKPAEESAKPAEESAKPAEESAKPAEESAKPAEESERGRRRRRSAPKSQATSNSSTREQA
jgi:peptidylprolyl isomerase